MYLTERQSVSEVRSVRGDGGRNNGGDRAEGYSHGALRALRIPLDFKLPMRRSHWWV